MKTKTIKAWAVVGLRGKTPYEEFVRTFGKKERDLIKTLSIFRTRLDAEKQKDSWINSKMMRVVPVEISIVAPKKTKKLS